MTDPFDSGIPKYSSAQDIYDGLRAMTNTEEMGILSEIGADVSWDNQDYYYYEKGAKLLEKFEELTDDGNELWKVDIAIAKIDGIDSNDMVYEALYNEDFGKRIGFKKLFCDIVLGGSALHYKEVSEAFYDEISEFNRFDFVKMRFTLNDVLKETIGMNVYTFPYDDLARSVYKKVDGLRLDDETKIVYESRALLTAYDDFLFGLKSNQYLYETQEQQYQLRLGDLKADYERKINALLTIAEKAGLLPAVMAELKMLGDGKETA